MRPGSLVDQLLRVAHHSRIGPRVARIEIGFRADDAVEVTIEFDVRAKKPLVRTEVTRRRVLEAYALGLPVGVDELAYQAHHDA
ncbi:hypothetical protein D3C72_2398340 [compost metagenome]